MKKVNKNNKFTKVDDEGYLYTVSGSNVKELHNNALEVVKDMQKNRPNDKALAKILKDYPSLKAKKRNKTKVRKVQNKPLSIVELYNKSFTYK